MRQPSNIAKLMAILSGWLDNWDKAASDSQLSHWVSFASGWSLNEIGKLVGVYRKVGETDSHLRSRIKVAIPNMTAGGTKDSLERAICSELETLPGAVEIHDGYTDIYIDPLTGEVINHYGHFWVKIHAWKTKDEDALWEVINKTKAAGVKCDYIEQGWPENQYSTDSFQVILSLSTMVESVTTSEPYAASTYHFVDITFTDSLNVIA
jgi:hypothetical protein